MNETFMNNYSIYEHLGAINAFLVLLIISIGVIFNTSTFFIIMLDKNLNKISSMIIFAFLTITDTCSLFTWNLDHFYFYFYNVDYEFQSLVLCRLMQFLQYFGLQTSAYLVTLLSVDRFFTIMSVPGSIFSKLPFSTYKTALIWSISILTFFFILNSHILFLNGYLDLPVLKNTTIPNLNNSTEPSYETVSYQSNDIHCQTYETGFQLNVVWNKLDIYLYSFIPFLIMTLFDCALILKTSKLAKNSSGKKKRNMTISLLIISVIYILTSMPNCLFYSYFYPIVYPNQLANIIGGYLDSMAFLNHAIGFFILVLTNLKFKNSVFDILHKLFKFKINDVAPLTTLRTTNHEEINE